MISSEAQRTLVKSPPELWNELSEPTSLSRHLGELGDIRITNMEPESVVEWEAELLSGSVKLEPSGWGTKVTLTVNRKLPESDDPAMPQMESPAEAAPFEDVAQPEQPLQPEQASHIEPETAGAAIEEPLPRRGFFARIFQSFKGRAHDPLATEPHSDAATVEEVPPEQDAPPAGDVAAAHDVTQAQDPDLASELAAAEEAIVAQDVALLTSVLDRLGAAHHRPFSRA